MEDAIDLGPFISAELAVEEFVVEVLDRPRVVRSVVVEIDRRCSHRRQALVDGSNHHVEVVEKRPIPVPNDVHLPVSPP